MKGVRALRECAPEAPFLRSRGRYRCGEIFPRKFGFATAKRRPEEAQIEPRRPSDRESPDGARVLLFRVQPALEVLYRQPCLGSAQQAFKKSNLGARKTARRSTSATRTGALAICAPAPPTGPARAAPPPRTFKQVSRMGSSFKTEAGKSRLWMRHATRALAERVQFVTERVQL
jgi:hypothetical protein